MTGLQYAGFRGRARRKPLFAGIRRRRFALPSLEAGLVVISLAAVTASAVTAPLDWNSLVFGRVEQVRLEGEYRHLDRLELEAIFKPLLGGNLIDLDLTRIEHRLGALPWVKAAVIRWVWPDTLIVRIKERQAVARWHDRGLVDRDGAVFFPQRGEYPELPLLAVEQAHAAEALAFYNRLSGQLEGSVGRPAVLAADARFSWRADFEPGFTLVLGRSELLPRVQRFVKAWHAGLGEVSDRIACVDLRYPDGFSVQWKQQREGVSC